MAPHTFDPDRRSAERGSLPRPRSLRFKDEIGKTNVRKSRTTNEKLRLSKRVARIR